MRQGHLTESPDGLDGARWRDRVRKWILILVCAACSSVFVAVLLLGAADLKNPSRSPSANPTVQPKPELSHAEQAWIAANPVVRVGVMPNRSPLEYMDDGIVRGLPKQYLNEVGRRTGLVFTFRPTQGTKSRLDWLKSGEIDMLSMASRNLGRVANEPGVLFTPAYIVSAAVVVTRARDHAVTELDELANKTVVVPEEGPYAELLKGVAGKVKLTSETRSTAVLDMVAEGDADATVGTELFLVPYLNRRYVGTLQIAGVLSSMTAEIAMAVSEEKPLLWSILQKTLRSISVERAAELRQSWLEEIDLGAPSMAVLVRHYGTQGLAALTTLLLLGFFSYRTWREYRRAVRSEREKEIFLSVMNQEIRTPMNTVLASVELLQGTSMDDRQRHLAGLADSGAGALLRLLDGVLDISKLEAGKVVLEYVPTDISNLARDVVDLQRLRAQEKGIGLSLTVPEASPILMLDPTRTNQILHNLVSNAIKFTERGGVDVQIAVSNVSDGEHRRALELRVSDTGIGISESAQAALFRPYSQVFGSPSRRPDGTGLGLLICRELVSLMKGKITLRSSTGVGTTVTVTLPVDLCVPGAVDEPEARVVSSSGERLRVLLVEGLPANQAVLQMQLASLGYDVSVAGDGARALQTYLQGSCDLVLMDCDLPDIDGYALAREFRRHDALRRKSALPIIAISAATGAEHALRCVEAGMDGAISKPIRLAKLRNAVERWGGSRASGITDADTR
ncbi:hypothetical protein AX27061_2229 [Achromobacter xylosoxidans NBRC 15126 = ATCC 27061]|nr:hypothetical protein AX27061_2229 [Achromobacter xylosoxidans NBRC 15126 = ATCC 27061]